MNNAAFREAVTKYFSSLQREKWAVARPERPTISIRIYKEKAPEANPYYSSNAIMHACLRTADEILGEDAYRPDQQSLAIIELYNDQETGEARLYQDFSYFVSHNIYSINRIAGGHRSSIENDTEIDFSVLLLKECRRDAFIQRIDAICSKYGTRWQEI